MKRKETTNNYFKLGLCIAFAFACNNPSPNSGQKDSARTEIFTSAMPPSFTIDVKARAGASLPSLQSFVWARQGNKILLLGGRTEGFHGRTLPDSSFKTSKANQSVFLIDLDVMQAWEMPLKMNDPEQRQFASTNMQFCQSGDRLYVVGGFGIKNQNDSRSNYTFDRLVAISINALIKQVQLGVKGSILKAIAGRATSPFLQVAGGEMIFLNNHFYLMFGQNYDALYDAGITGKYTSAIRQFSFTGNNIIDTLSYVDSSKLHRRDLPMASVIQKSKTFYAAYGGVFSANDDGYQNPVYLNVGGGKIVVFQDTLLQKTNQYDCAIVSIFDSIYNCNTSVLLGGIGKYQFHPETQKWEDGDGGAKLPFVKTITQMKFYNNTMHQDIQLPPQRPELPDFVGANAVFFPDTTYLYANHIQTIDYNKLTNDTTRIGIMYGGIKASAATSSEFYPTSLNKTIYDVYVYKNK
jgi:hypothetical protein